MVCMAYTLSAGVENLPTAVFDQDKSPESREVVAALRSSGCFAPDTYVASMSELERLLDEGAVQAGLVIPRGFGSKLCRQDEAQLQLLLDGTHAITAQIARAYAEEIMARYAARKATLGSMVIPLEPVVAETRAWFNEDLRSENFFIPGEMGAILAFLALALTSITIVREREMGTLEQLLVTPLRAIELIVAKALVVLLLTFVGLLGMVAAALYWFRVPLRGSLTLLLGLSAFFILVEMGWGLLISTAAKTQGQALMAAFFLNSLDVIMSGYIVPLAYMPRAAQLGSALVPLRYYIVITRGIFLKGSTLGDLWPQVGALAALGVLLFGLAAARFRRGLE